MGLVTTLVTLPGTGPIRGVLWVMDHVVRAAEEQLYDEERLLAELRSLAGALDRGEITESEHAA